MNAFRFQTKYPYQRYQLILVFTILSVAFLALSARHIHYWYLLYSEGLTEGEAEIIEILPNKAVYSFEVAGNLITDEVSFSYRKGSTLQVGEVYRTTYIKSHPNYNHLHTDQFLRFK